MKRQKRQSPEVSDAAVNGNINVLGEHEHDLRFF